MQINFDAVLVDFTGQAMKEPGSDGSKTDRDLRLGVVAALALNLQSEGDTPVSAARRGDLARRVWSGGEVDLDPEDVSLIRGCLHRIWTPLIVSQARDLLDPK